MLRKATPGDPLRLGVLVSGAGTNLQVLLDTFNAAPHEARVVAVASTRPGVRALERATATRGSPTGSTATAWSSSCAPAGWES